LDGFIAGHGDGPDSANVVVRRDHAGYAGDNSATYTVNVILTTSGTAAGAQFDLNYDPTQLTVTVDSAVPPLRFRKELSTICLGQALPGCSQPAQNNPSQGTINNGPDGAPSSPV